MEKDAPGFAFGATLGAILGVASGATLNATFCAAFDGTLGLFAAVAAAIVAALPCFSVMRQYKMQKEHRQSLGFHMAYRADSALHFVQNVKFHFETGTDYNRSSGNHVRKRQ